MPGLLQTAPQQRQQPGGMIPQVQASAPRMQPPDGMAMFAAAADELMATDREVFGDFKQRARAFNLQFQQMNKLMQIGALMGEDVSALQPIMNKLQENRQKMIREILGRANVPTSAGKPGRANIPEPGM